MARKKSVEHHARTIVKVVLVAGAIAFAVEGGEYGTSDLLEQRTRERRLRQELDSLSRIVDSLARYRRRVETDPRLQERIAREEFGFVRGNKELLYRFAEPDTGGARTRSQRP
jgi:cell division protein FtsB